MNILLQIDNRVKAACFDDKNAFSPAFYDRHLKVVERYALQLADLLKADAFIVNLAALLHDLAAIEDFSILSDHARCSADFAGRILTEMNVAQRDVEMVVQCIQQHSMPVSPEQYALEIVCISNADAMSQMTNPAYWLYYAFSVRKMTFDEGKAWYYKLITDRWPKLADPAKEIIYEQYHRALQICS